LASTLAGGATWRAVFWVELFAALFRWLDAGVRDGRGAYRDNNPADAGSFVLYSWGWSVFLALGRAGNFSRAF